MGRTIHGSMCYVLSLLYFLPLIRVRTELFEQIQQNAEKKLYEKSASRALRYVIAHSAF